LDVYDFTGAISNQYAGGVDAPPLRVAQLTGVLNLKTEAREGQWAVIGTCAELSGNDGTKPLAEQDLRQGRLGKWTATIPADESPVYTWNERPAVPSPLNAVWWPILWRPVDSPQPLKVGESVTAAFSLPLQTFLEDDPIGAIPIRVRYVFQGPSYLTAEPTWLFDVEANEQISRSIKHPERDGLRIEGTVSLRGTLRVRRSDGRMEYGKFNLTADLRLAGEGLPFGTFSSARALVTAEYKRKVASER
jgi:hypothetical protein